PTPTASARPPAPADDAADLALVPADAAGFVHVRFADLWKNDLFAGLKKTWDRAGAKALAALDRQFVPAPSTLERATVFVLLDPESKQPQPFGIVRFSAPFDPALVAKLYLPKAEKAEAGATTVYVDGNLHLAVAFPDNRHALIGMPGAVEAYLVRKPAKDGPLAPALKLAATRPVVAAANIAALPIPPNALDEVPEDVRPILTAEQLVVSMDLGAEARLEARATYRTPGGAADAEKAVRALVDLGRRKIAEQQKELEGKLFDPAIKTPRPADELPDALGAVFGLGALGRLDDFLADAKLVARDGKDLTFSAAMPKELVATVGGFAAIGVGLALPAVQKVREAAARAQSQNNLKQIALAIHNYESANGKLPEDIKDADGKPLLSWRVAILPYIEQEPVYKLFKLDEPWDSDANKKASQVAIKVFVSPNATTGPVGPDGYGLTNYLGVAGPDTIFDPEGGIRIVGITDGTSNTVMAVESAAAVPWAKPGDYLVEAGKALPKLVPPGNAAVLNVAMGDGSVRAVNPAKVPEKIWRMVFSRNGGEVIPADWEEGK
ncbi:MAG: DUF1559 domain-containing protein, partial [Gemmataceae bacterium]|nr:DUF1559 domain-containing protein [Gemmataceae bacterium]